MNKTYLATLTALAALALQPLHAQDAAQYRLADDTQLWRLTDNAAGLSLDSSSNRGIAYFDLQHREGDFHRVQEGGTRNQLAFFTERYQTISPVLVGYGSFRFDMGRTKGRAWCDAMRPYNANPFFAGSSVKGNYDTQQFDLTAAIGTIQLWGFTAGLRLDYKVGDLSRLRDPRSRSELLDYKLTPSLTYTSGQHTFGLSGHYNRRKEKNLPPTTVQQDPNLQYYLMSGMEQATGTVGGYSGFSREWVDHRFGAELSYAFRRGGLHSLNSVSIEHGTEDAWGTYKYEPGKYSSYRYGFSSRNRISRGSVQHALDLEASCEQAYADEYRQQLVQERDAEKGYTSYRYETLITFKKRYQVQLFNAGLHHRLNFTRQSGNQRRADKVTTGYVGERVAFSHASNKHLLPQSYLHYGAYELSLEGGKSLLRNRRLWVDAQAGYHAAVDTKLSLSEPATDYATQVLLPDLNYYDANYWRGQLSVTYQFPLRIKGQQALWFVRAYGDHTTASHSLTASTVGISIGMFN